MRLHLVLLALPQVAAMLPQAAAMLPPREVGAVLERVEELV